MKSLPRQIPGITVTDMAKDDRQRLTRSINFDTDPKLLEEIEKESSEFAKAAGFPESFGAYVRHLIKTHPARRKIKKK